MLKKILVIEPEMSQCVLLKKLLTDRYALTFVRDAAEAIVIVARAPFSVIVFNMGPAQEKIIDELKALKMRLPDNTMIIAITTYNTLEIERTIALSGVFYHLLAPYDVKDLVDLIDAAFRNVEREYPTANITGFAHE